MRKLIYILAEQDATDSDKVIWSKLNYLSDKLIHATADFHAVNNRDELYAIEQQLIREGWVKFSSKDDITTPYQAIDMWVKTLD